MGVTHQSWYNLQALRNYPLDDTATAVDDGGWILSEDMLVDCNIRFAGSINDRLMLTAITASPTLVTALFAKPTGELMAAVNVVKPIVVNKPYPITALVDGVVGWVVFGPGANTTQHYRFSSSDQSLLLSRCARSYLDPRVKSIAKAGRTSLLTGIVNIKPGTDLSTDIEPVLIDGKTRNAIVLRLSDDNSQQNLLEAYNSPCEPRPESNNCRRPGIRTINSVGPDCDGNINIIFEGMTAGAFQTPAPAVQTRGGITLDYHQGLGELCELVDQKSEPTKIDYCGDNSSIYLPEITSSEISKGDVDPLPGCIHGLPVCTVFDTPTFTGFQTKHGVFGKLSPPVMMRSLCDAEDDGPSNTYASVANYDRNVAIYNSCETDGNNMQVTVDICMSTNAARQNAMAVLSWKKIGNVETYFTATLDMTGRCLKIQRFNGTGFITELASSVLPLQFLHWYRLSLKFSGVTNSGGTCTATASGLTNPGFPTTTLITTSSRFDKDATGGLAGVGSDNAICYFSGFWLRYWNA